MGRVKVEKRLGGGKEFMNDLASQQNAPAYSYLLFPRRSFIMEVGSCLLTVPQGQFLLLYEQNVPAYSYLLFPRRRFVMAVGSFHLGMPQGPVLLLYEQIRATLSQKWLELPLCPL